jgi:hypothetical protein
LPQRGHSATSCAVGVSVRSDIDRLLRPAISRFNMRPYPRRVSGKIFAKPQANQGTTCLCSMLGSIFGSILTGAI